MLCNGQKLKAWASNTRKRITKPFVKAAFAGHPHLQKHLAALRARKYGFVYLNQFKRWLDEAGRLAFLCEGWQPPGGAAAAATAAAEPGDRDPGVPNSELPDWEGEQDAQEEAKAIDQFSTTARTSGGQKQMAQIARRDAQAHAYAMTREPVPNHLRHTAADFPADQDYSAAQSKPAAHPFAWLPPAFADEFASLQSRWVDEVLRKDSPLRLSYGSGRFALRPQDTDFRHLPFDLISDSDFLVAVALSFIKRQGRKSTVVRDAAGDLIDPNKAVLMTDSRIRMLKSFLTVWIASKEIRRDRLSKKFTRTSNLVSKIMKQASLRLGAVAREFEQTRHADRVISDYEVRQLLEWVCRPGRTVGDLQLEVLYIFSTFFHFRTGANLNLILMNHIAFDAEAGLFTLVPWGTKSLKNKGSGKGQFRETLTRKHFPRQFAALHAYMLLRQRVPAETFAENNKANMFFANLRRQPTAEAVCSLDMIVLESTYATSRTCDLYTFPLHLALLTPEIQVFEPREFDADFRRGWLVAKLTEAGITEEYGGRFSNKSLRGHLATLEKSLGLNSWGGGRERERTSQAMYAHEALVLGRRLFANYPNPYPISHRDRYRLGEIRDIPGDSKHNILPNAALVCKCALDGTLGYVCVAGNITAFAPMHLLAKSTLTPQSKNTDFGNLKRCARLCPEVPTPPRAKAFAPPFATWRRLYAVARPEQVNRSRKKAKTNNNK